MPRGAVVPPELRVPRKEWGCLRDLFQIEGCIRGEFLLLLLLLLLFSLYLELVLEVSCRCQLSRNEWRLGIFPQTFLDQRYLDGVDRYLFAQSRFEAQKLTNKCDPLKGRNKRPVKLGQNFNLVTSALSRKVQF